MADSLEDGAQKPIILTKVKKIPAGAHGGAWKVAYADFVTAMMAFFLLLWLLSVATEDQRAGISRYFDPSVSASGQSGLGDILAGLAPTSDQGALRSASSPPQVTIPIPAYGGEVGTGGEGTERESTQEDLARQAMAQEVQEEEERLDRAAAAILQMIREQPELKDLENNLQFEMTPEGLRIQILDTEENGMFEGDSAVLTRRARRLIALVASVVVTLPNTISISGHTDGGPQPANAPMDKWALSGARAVSTRDWLVDAGLAPARIATLAGRGDQDLLIRQEPENPRNRRVSILLARQTADLPSPLPQ